VDLVIYGFWDSIHVEVVFLEVHEWTYLHEFMYADNVGFF